MTSRRIQLTALAAAVGLTSVVAPLALTAGPASAACPVGHCAPPPPPPKPKPPVPLPPGKTTFLPITFDRYWAQGAVLLDLKWDALNGSFGPVGYDMTGYQATAHCTGFTNGLAPQGVTFTAPVKVTNPTTLSVRLTSFSNPMPAINPGVTCEIGVTTPANTRFDSTASWALQTMSQDSNLYVLVHGTIKNLSI